VCTVIESIALESHVLGTILIVKVRAMRNSFCALSRVARHFVVHVQGRAQRRYSERLESTLLPFMERATPPATERCTADPEH
jgi:hypothetical protein